MDSRPSANDQPAEPYNFGWFATLPKDQQRRIIAEDEAHLASWEEVYARARRSWMRPAFHGSLLFGIVTSYVTLFSATATIAGLVAGAITGWIWNRVRAGQVLSPLIAVLMFWLSLDSTGHLNFAAIVWAPFPIIVVSMYLSLRRAEPFGS